MHVDALLATSPAEQPINTTWKQVVSYLKEKGIIGQRESGDPLGLHLVPSKEPSIIHAERLQRACKRS